MGVSELCTLVGQTLEPFLPQLLPAAGCPFVGRTGLIQYSAIQDW